MIILNCLLYFDKKFCSRAPKSDQQRVAINPIKEGKMKKVLMQNLIYNLEL
jgi:hypothetical protein